MTENQRNLCRFPYLDNANFQPSKMKLVLEKNGIVPINYSYKIQTNGHIKMIVVQYWLFVHFKISRAGVEFCP